jgi:predicted nucleic acid-binding protein
LAKLSGLPIENDLQTFDHAWTTTLELADRFNLSVYDACYLEPVHRRGLPLVSLDMQLRRAARTLAIPLLGG